MIPTRDRLDVRRAARCALGQEGAAVEVIVVDDGSAVPAARTLGDLGDDFDNHLTVVRHDVPRGVAAARNHGLELASAPWVGFCDDDDFWAPTKVRCQLDAADGHGWTCCAAMRVDEQFRMIMYESVPDPDRVADAILPQNGVPGGGSGVIARTELVRQLGGFDPAFSVLADWDLWIRLATATPLAVTEHPLVAYVVHPSALSLDTALLEDERRRLERKHADVYARRGATIDEIEWRLYLADVELRSGHRYRATRQYLAAVRQGSIRSWRPALASLVHPGWLQRRHRAWSRLWVPDKWIAESEPWIAAATAPAASGRQMAGNRGGRAGTDRGEKNITGSRISGG